MSSSLSCYTSRQTNQDGDFSYEGCIGRKRYHCKTRKQQRQLQKSSKLSSATVKKCKLNFRNASVVSITLILMIHVSLFLSTAVEAFIAADVNLHRRFDPLQSPSSQLSRPRSLFSHRHPSSHLYHPENDSNNSSYHSRNDGNSNSNSNTHHFNSHRRKFLISGTTVMSSLILRKLPPSYATVTDPKTGISQPEVGEIQDAVPKDWTKIENPFLNEFDKSSFGRLDQNPDTIFYESPRFVEHIDKNAVEIVTKYNTDVIVSTANAKQSDTTVASKSDDTLPPKVRVLDLCSSWTSHIDPNVVVSSVPQSNNNNNIDNKNNNNSDKKKKKIMAQISGLGMNAEELKSNPLLSDWTIQDLNSNPDLSKIFPNDNTFDVVFCQLSIDYLTRPMEVLREVSRVLKVGGTVHIIFSNRLFLSKAVALWTGADDVDHTFYVSSYLHFCGGNFHNIEAVDLSSRRSSATKGGQLIVGDPVFVVRAVKG